MNNNLKATWWIWWGDPLIDLHSDQSKRIPKSILTLKDLSFEDIQFLRTRLSLPERPEDEIITKKFRGVIALLNDEDYIESKQTISGLTFDQSYLKMPPAQWSSVYQIEDKDHIRGILSISSTVSEKTAEVIREISKICKEEEPLSISSRLKAVMAFYFSKRYPLFFSRWVLTLSNAELKPLERIINLKKDAEDEFLNLIEGHLDKLVGYMEDRYLTQEVDFDEALDLDLFE